MKRVAEKWRPPMSLVVAAVCGTLLAVPLIVMLALQIWTNRFVNETESSLLKQAAIYAGAYAFAFEDAKHDLGGATPGYYLPPDKRVFWNAQARTFQPLLNLRKTIIEPVRPDAAQSSATLDARYRRVGPQLADLATNAGRTTLSGVTFLDYQGLDLTSEAPASYATAPEVREALRGDVGAALRWRSESAADQSLLSFVRGTGFRVLIAYPVISENRVIGAVYMSRTPQDLGKYLSDDGISLLILAVATAISALAVGTLLVRTILRPIRALRDQSNLVAGGADNGPEPLAHYGMREIAELGKSVITMADSLAMRRKAIEIYTNHVTHELKSPVTAIIGAAELLEDETLPPETVNDLLKTVTSQGRRMEKLLDQLREITRARTYEPGPPGELIDMKPSVPGIDIEIASSSPTIPLSTAHGETVLTHLAQNARNHGANKLRVDWNGKTLRVTDNGSGFGDADLDRLAEPFYTTRRAQGGTGFGLAIVAAILTLYAARLTPVRVAGGGAFEIKFGQRI